MTPQLFFRRQESRCRSGQKCFSIAYLGLAIFFCIILNSITSRSSYAQTQISDTQSGAGVLPQSKQGCPSLLAFYPGTTFENSQDSWVKLSAELALLSSRCLRSSEYFALVGAAQLNLDQNDRALESLERALLLDPESGAARVDYAQALYNDGQLFAALQINNELLSEESLPRRLREELGEREQHWRLDTSQRSLLFDVSAGYDNNLNGAPSAREILLTLSGEPLVLPLGEAFQSNSGSFGDIRIENQFTMLAPEHQQRWVTEARGRVTPDSSSDLVQLESTYSFLKPRRDNGWGIQGGLSHLLFGGSSLFSAAQLSGRYEFRLRGMCRSTVELAGQRQYFRQQRMLDSLEGMASVGLSCGVGGNDFIRGSNIGLSFGLIQNHALESARPGGDREGSQIMALWQSDRFLFQVSRTQLDDRRGYSSILAGGSRRWVARNQAAFQHRTPVRLRGKSMIFMFNIFHQDQESNISLFSVRDTTLEIGLRFSL